MQKVVFSDRNTEVVKLDYDFVDFVNFKPEEARTAQEEKEPEEEKKEMPKEIKQVETEQVKMEDIDVDMPDLDLDQNFDNVDMNAVAVVQNPKPKTNFTPTVSTPQYLTNIKPMFNVKPRYPRIAKRKNITGYVIVRFTIDINGNVKNIIIKESSPKGFFEKSAKEAISRWRFPPKKSGGVLVEQFAEQKLEFKLR